MSYNPKTNKWEYDYKPPYNPGWTYSHNRRKHQRKLNKAMRLVNQNIENDSLWKGRFYVRSGWTKFYEYEDRSGYELICELIFIDKQTGKTVNDYKTVNEWCCFRGHDIYCRMNDFIVKDCGVWTNISNE